MAYERIEPFEPQRHDMRVAMQTAALVNMQIPRGKPRAKAADFMPEFDSRYTAKPADPRAAQDAFIAAIGGKINGR